MFYSVQVLSKGGPLQIIWLAAHMDKDLKRQQIDSTSISDAVDTIILPSSASTSASQTNEAPLALRLSGQLLLGLVKIFDRKVTYLKHDCEEALQKMVPSTKEEEGEDRGRHSTQHAAPPATKRTKKAVTPRPPGNREEGMGEGSNERNNNNGTLQQFAVEEDEIFGGGSKSDPSPDSLKATAGASTSAKVASTMLVAPHAPRSAAEMIGAPSRPSLNAGKTVIRDADDEMFDPVPEQFDFDLHDHEIQELAKSKGQVPLPEMDAGNLRTNAVADNDDDDDDMGGDAYGYGGEADDEADPYAHPEGDGPSSSSGRREEEIDKDVAALVAMGTMAPDGLLAVKAARGSQGADIRGLSFSRHQIKFDPAWTLTKEEYSRQLKDSSAIVRPLSAITRGFAVTDLAKQVAGGFNTWGYEEFVRPDTSEFANLADSAGNGPSSSAAASVSIGEAARRRLNMAEGLPPVEYLVWSLPTWAADELWNLTATAILGPAARDDDGKLLDNEASLAPSADAEREEGVKRSRDSMEEGTSGAPSTSAAAQKENSTFLVPSSLAQPSPAARPSTSNGSQRALSEDFSDAAAMGGDGWDEVDDDGWLGTTPKHRDWATDDEERSISRRSGGAASTRLGEEAQSLDERSRAATGDAGFTARTKALVSRLKQLLLPSTLALPAIPESARALFGSQSQSQPFANGPPSKRQKTDVANMSPSSTSSDLPGTSNQKAAGCTLSQLLPPPLYPEKIPMVKGSLQLPAPPPFQSIPSAAAAASAASSAPVAATPTKAPDTAGAAAAAGTPGLHAKRRMRAAQTFYDLLVLQNRGFVRLNQPEAYEDLGVLPLAPIAIATSTQSAGLPADLVNAAAGALF